MPISGNIISSTPQGPPGALAVSAADPLALSSIAASALSYPVGTLAYVQSLDAYFRYLPTGTAAPDGVNAVAADVGVWMRVGTIFEADISYALGAPTSVTVPAAHALVVLDSSGWTNQGALLITLPALPFVGQRVVVFEDGWVGGRPAPQVAAGTNAIVPYSRTPQGSKPRAPGSTTTLTDFGAYFAWMWSGSLWVPG